MTANVILGIKMTCGGAHRVTPEKVQMQDVYNI